MNGPRTPNKPIARTTSKRQTARPDPEAAPINSIRMDAARLDQFLDLREEVSGGSGAAMKRSHVRHAYRAVAVRITLVHPGGSQARLNVACRNLSSGGIGVLHSAYVHTGTPCIVELTNSRKVTQTIEGRVVRCTHVQGTIHDVGVRFERPINTKDFLALDPFADRFSLENVDPQNLTGTVLYIEDVTMDQAVVRHYLRQTQMQLVIAATADEAMEKALKGVDIILCNHQIGGVPGASIIKRMREAGISQPILIVTADTSPATREMLAVAQCNAFITKPLNQNTLFRALGEFVASGTAGGGIFSTLAEGHPNAGLVETFVNEVHEYARQIEAAVAANDATRVRALCLQIRGSAPIMGFERLAEMALAAETILAGNGSLADASVAIKTLTSACSRTSSRAA
ncbi:MAG: response regulator [Phycisphaerales bacterium]